MAALESEVVPSAPTFLAPANSELTTKQNLFVHYYLQTRNGVKSAKLAGYLGEYNVLNSIAIENLQKPAIRNAIENYFQSRIISRECVLAELSDLASVPLSEMQPKQAENGQFVPSVLKPSDKIKSLELVGKFHGLFADRSESINVNIDLKAEDLASILQGALSAGAIDVTPEVLTPQQDTTDNTSRT